MLEKGRILNPGCYMVWRRVSLFLVGIAGGLFVAAILFVSVVEERNTRSRNNYLDDNYYPKPEIMEKTYAFSEDSHYLPKLIQGTSLYADRLVIYEGPFLEDGSNREVTDVAALIVRNVGENEIISCGIEVCFEEASYYFCGKRIPPGATVLMIERRGELFRLDPVISCVGWQITEDDKQEAAELVTIEERAMGTLVVTNLSNRILNEIYIFYKNWLSPPDILVGGIVYSVIIPKLLPGQTEILHPYHFVSGYSKIVSVVSE